MTMETFVQIINISLVVLFVGLIAGLLIAIFRGIKKGIWKATFKLFFILACFLAAIFSLNVLANYVGMFDISPFHIPDLKFTGKAEYIVVFDSTLKEGAYEIVKGLLISQGLPYTPKAAELAYALAESIVKFVTFFVEVIVIVIVGNLISSLLWHILFKHFIPKIVRKRVKFKAISSIETALKYVVTSFMMLAPLTALVNTINIAYQRNKRGNTDGVMAYIDSFLNAYDDSLFAKVFFSWTVNDQGLTFDASFMNAITMSTYQEGSIGFVESLYDLTSIAALTGQAVVINTDGSTPTITWTIALEGEFVGSLIDLLINSKLITYILPIAAELGLALVDDPNIEEKIDLDAINWKEELTALKELYQSLYNAGFADYVLTEDGQLQTNYVVEDLLESIISNDKQYNTMLNAIASLDDHEIIKQAIPYAVYYLVEKNRDDEGNTTLPYLPDTWEEIKSVTWCDDLCLVLKTAKRMYDVNPDVLHQVFDLTKSDSSAAMLSAKFADGGDDKYEALIGSIAQNLDKYVTILAGQRSATDPYELANLDEYGKTVLPGGKETDTIYETIFDASLMKYAVRYIPTLLEGKEGIPEEVAQTLTDLNDEYWRLNYKEELNAMLYCLEVVSGRPDDAKEIYSTIKQMTGSGSEDILSLITDSMVHIFSSMLPRTDHSRILNSFAYPYAKKYVEEFDFNENLGLSNEIIKFAVDRACDERRLGASLIPVVDAFPSIKVIMDDLDIKLANSSSSIASHRIKYASEAKEQIQLLAEHYLDVNNVLNAFYECDLINPVLSLDEMNDTGFMQNENYVNLISFVYNMVTDLGVDTVKSLVLDANVANWVNENMMISLAIKAVGESDIMSLLDQEMTNALMLQLSDKVETVFTAIGDSASFSKIMGPFLDKTLDSLSGSLLTDGVCFSNVVDWKLEASKMATLMRTIGNSSFDINNLDFSNISNVVDLNNLLHALEDSTIFRHVELDGSVTELFSIWAYNKIYSFLDEFKDGAGNSYALGTDPTDDPTLSDYPHHYLKNDFLSVDGSEWYGEGFIVKEKSLFDDPDFYEKYVDILNADELGRMAKVVYWGNKIANDSGSSSIMELDAEFIVNTLQSLNDSKVLRIGVYNFYKIAQDRFENDFLNLKAANLSYLLDCGQGVGAENTLELRALRKQEVDVFTDLYAELKKVNDMGVIDMNNNTFNFDLVDDELADEVQSIVNRIVTSRVFHTDGPQPGSGEFTVFQGVLVKSMEALDKYDIIYNSSSPKDIYHHDLYESYKESTETIGKGKIKYLIDRYFNYTKAVTNPSEQIEYLNEAFEIARAAFGLKKGDGSGTSYIGIKDKDGKISTNIDNYNMADPAFLTAVRQVLENVQESEVLNDISLNGIAKVLSKADSMVDGLNVKFSSANVYYAYGVQNVTGVDFSKCNWDAGIQDEDIELLLYLVEQVGLYRNGEKSDIPDISNISTDLDKVDSIGIRNILETLFDSNMFHKAGPAVTLTPSGSGFVKSYVNSEVIDGNTYNFTVAQSLIKEILSVDEIKGVYYLAESPKDQYKVNYSTAAGKIAYNIYTTFPYGNSYSYVDMENEVIAITDFVESLKGLGTVDFDNLDLEDENLVNAIEDALLTSRQSKLLKDLPLNLIYKMLIEADDMVSGLEGVKFSNANVFYVYGVQDKDDFSKCNWEATIEIEDIDTITYLLRQVGKYQKGEPCDIPNISTISSDVTSLNPTGIENLLNTLFESKMFHMAGPAMKLVDLGGGTYAKTYVNTEVVDGRSYNFTVSQGIMRAILNVDEVKGYYYLSDSPKDVYFSYNGTNYNTVGTKIAYNVKSIFPYGSSASIDSIKGEIHKISEFISSIKELGTLNLDSFDFTDNNILNNIENVLLSSSKSQLLKDVPLNAIYKMLETAQSKVTGFDNLKLSNTYVFYAYGIHSYTNLDECNWEASLQQEDADIIHYLIEQIGLYENHDADCDIPLMDDIGDDLTKVRTSGVKNLLNNVFMTNMFHKAGPAMKLVDTGSGLEARYVNEEVIDGQTRRFTIAQSFVRELLDLDTVSKYYFTDSSPKDQYNKFIGTNYQTVAGKIAYNVNTIFPYGLSASSKDIEDEIVAIANFIDSVKGIGSLDVDDFNFADDNFVSSVQEVLRKASASKLLKDFPLNLLADMLSEANDKLTGLSNVNLSSAFVYYAYGIQDKDDFSKCNWEASISESDIATIGYLIKQSGLYENHDADCDIPVISDFEDDIEKVNTEGIKTVLKQLFSSNMFHKAGPAMGLVNNGGTLEKQYLVPETIDGTTYRFSVAQGMIREILSLDDVKDVYYLGDNSPKDKNATNYISVNGKIAENLYSVFPYGLSSSEILINGEIDRIGSFIDALKEFGTVSIGNIDFGDVDPAATNKLFRAANESKLFMDLVPNSMYKIFTSMGTSSDFSSLVDFGDADVFYHYRTSSGTDNYKAKFPVNEIDNITDLMNLYQKFIGPDGLDADEGGKIDDFASFSRVLRKGYLWDILISLHNSDVMHAQNKYKLTTKVEAQKLKDAYTTYDSDLHMTVYEQVINMMVEESQISSFIYKYENGLDTTPANPETTYRYEMLLKIKTISILEIKGVAESDIFADYAGYNMDWISNENKDSAVNDELHALYRFFGNAMDAMKGELKIENVTLTDSGMDPDEVQDLLYSLNKADIISKAVEAIIYDGFKSMDLIQYTKYHDVMKAKFDLGQEGYGGKITDFDNPERLDKTEIHLVRELLYNLSYKNPLDNNKRNLYYNFTNIEDLAQHIESLDGAMTYMKNSAIFAVEFDPTGYDPTVPQLNGRSLLMANIFKSIQFDTGGSKTNLLDYFVGSTYEQKILNIYKIFNFDSIDFKTLAEAQGVHYLLKNASAVKDITSMTTGSGYDVSGISGQLDTIHKLMDDCTFVIDGIECRSFFVSQIVGETLNDIIKNEESIILTTHGMSAYIPVRFGPLSAFSVTASSYEETITYDDNSDGKVDRVSIPVDDVEADGLTASLVAIDYMGRVANDYASILIDKLNPLSPYYGQPLTMDRMNGSNFAVLHSEFTKMGKSYFARVLYLSRMHSGILYLRDNAEDDLFDHWATAITEYIGDDLSQRKLYESSFNGFAYYSTGLGWHLF